MHVFDSTGNMIENVEVLRAALEVIIKLTLKK
jgi:hypothetical protein